MGGIGTTFKRIGGSGSLHKQDWLNVGLMLAAAAGGAAVPGLLPGAAGAEAAGAAGAGAVAGDAFMPAALAGTEGLAGTAGLGAAGAAAGDAFLPGALQGTEGLAGVSNGLLAPSADAMAMGQNGLTPSGVNAGPQQQGLLSKAFGGVKDIAGSPLTKAASGLANMGGGQQAPAPFIPRTESPAPIPDFGKLQSQYTKPITVPGMQGQIDPQQIAMILAMLKQQGGMNG